MCSDIFTCNIICMAKELVLSFNKVYQHFGFSHKCVKSRVIMSDVSCCADN